MSLALLSRAWPYLAILTFVLWVWRVDYLRATYKEQVHDMQVVARAKDKEYRAKEKQWATGQAVIVKGRDDEIEKLNTTVDGLLVQLRNRPRRPTSEATVNSNAGQEAPASCTGSQLYRDDAEFLTREAALADAVKIELKSCYAQYENLLK